MRIGREQRAARLVARLAERLYGRPLVRNVLRGELVEQIVLDLLGPEWTDAGDYEAWDIVRPADGRRIQVKQAAAKQTWHHPGERTVPRFDIAERIDWLSNPYGSDTARVRFADLFVFAWHPVLDGTADHRDVEQWLFYVIQVTDLPAGQRSIGLSGLGGLTLPVHGAQLAGRIELIAK